MRKDLISLFKEYGDKKEILSKLCESEKLRKYNSSELHIIEAVGDLENSCSLSSIILSVCMALYGHRLQQMF